MRARACVRVGFWACACVCVRVALLIQHATRVRHIVTSYVDPQSLPYFSILSHKWHDFRENVTGHKMCVLTFCTFVYNIPHCENNLARYCHKYENIFM